ncbi:MAG: RDD family protein [Bacteroidetes bacterium]|nr:RDD family protein [Bacteroidota bacterium]MBS1977217.1 RDD family protein [Bacteroidota bacterium]
MNDNYAGFWLRLVALIIDAIIIGIIQSFVAIPIFAAIGITAVGGMENLDMSDADNVVGLVGAIVAAAGVYWVIATTVQLLYFSFMESSNLQGTVGKMALGLKVTDMQGGKLDLGKAFLRNLCKLISNITMLIGYIMAGFTEKKQALHDMIAGTLVVKK